MIRKVLHHNIAFFAEELGRLNMTGGAANLGNVDEKQCSAHAESNVNDDDYLGLNSQIGTSK